MRSLLLVALLLPTAATAHSMRQRVSNYSDTQGATRQRLSLDLSAELWKRGEVLTSSELGLTVQGDSIASPAVDDESEETERRSVETVAIAAGQAWGKRTETTQTARISRDEDYQSRAVGLGMARWFYGDSLRASLDVSRSQANQPASEYLDYDAEVVTLPTAIDATGAQVGLRHLATKTTIVDYGVAYVSTSNRPAAQTYSVKMRQFVPQLRGAMHGSVARGVNRGRIENTTNFGQVSAWQWDVAFLKSLWSKADARVGYRYYREDEVTRAYEDELVFGSDTISVNFSQGLSSNAKRPVVLEAGAARYLTNADLSATIYEVGAYASF